MPLYRLETRMAHDMVNAVARKWRNTWYTEANSSAAAAALGVGLWIGYLRNAARDRVYCYEVYAVDLNPATDDFTVQPVPTPDQRGVLAAPLDGEPYYPEVCFTVTLNVQGSRPSRKFWRPGLYEGDVQNGRVGNPVLVAAVSDQLNGFMTGNPGLLVDPDNEPLLTVGRVTLSDREFGRESTVDVPAPPPLPA